MRSLERAGSRLERLKLQNLDDCLDARVLAPLRHCVRLTELNLAHSTRLTLAALLTVLPPPPLKLERLSVKGLGLRPDISSYAQLYQRTKWIDSSYCATCGELSSCSPCVAPSCTGRSVCDDCAWVCRHCGERRCKLPAQSSPRLFDPGAEQKAWTPMSSQPCKDTASFECPACDLHTCSDCAADPAQGGVACLGLCDRVLCMSCLVQQDCASCEVCELVVCHDCMCISAGFPYAIIEGCSRCQRATCWSCTDRWPPNHEARVNGATVDARACVECVAVV